MLEFYWKSNFSPNERVTTLGCTVFGQIKRISLKFPINYGLKIKFIQYFSFLLNAFKTH